MLILDLESEFSEPFDRDKWGRGHDQRQLELHHRRSEELVEVEKSSTKVLLMLRGSPMGILLSSAVNLLSIWWDR